MNDRRQPHRLDRRQLVPRAGGRRAHDAPAEWVSIAVFARRYGISRVTVYKWLEANLLEIYRVGDLLRIRNLPPDQHVPNASQSKSVSQCTGLRTQPSAGGGCSAF